MKRWLPILALVVLSSTTTAIAQGNLVELKAAMMSADYRGDLVQLEDLRKRAERWTADEKLGYLADYWRGYANWRIAINGANAKLPAGRIQTYLERAAKDFESSIRKNDQFADAYASAASVHGWLAALKSGNGTAMQRELVTANAQLKKALELAPSNPRVLWVQATPYLYLPAERGGNPQIAMELYRRMIDTAPPLAPESPLPDWGRVEGLMSLAYAHVYIAPDLDAAQKEARAALEQQPDWKYVKTILMPEIETRLKQR